MVTFIEELIILSDLPECLCIITSFTFELFLYIYQLLPYHPVKSSTTIICTSVYLEYWYYLTNLNSILLTEQAHLLNKDDCLFLLYSYEIR